MYDVLDISDYVIRYSCLMGMPVNNLRLQKLLYYIQAQFLVLTGRPCFKDKIEAWQTGPVVPRAYYEYSHYAGCSIIPADKKGISEYESLIPVGDRCFINGVIKGCKKYSTATLIKFTQNQTPWEEAYIRKDRTITNDSMLEFFAEELINDLSKKMNKQIKEAEK